MAQYALNELEQYPGRYPWDRVFVTSVDPAEGVSRVLYVDPLDLTDTRDYIYEPFEITKWGTA